MELLAVCLALLAGYLLGNLNGAVISSRLFMKEDVRAKGSGNAGITNFYRNYGKHGSLLVALIDIGKTVAAAFLGLLVFRLLHVEGQGTLAKMLGGSGAVLGHMFPALLRFRGGKGVMSGAALMLVMDWRMFLIALGIFALVFFTTHYVSLASIITAASYGPLFLVFYRGQWPVVGLSVFISWLAIFMHRANLSRLRHGTESKTYLNHKE